MALLLNRTKLNAIFKKLENEPFLANVDRGGEIEEELIRKCVWITNTQTSVYWFVAISAFASAVLNSFVQRIKSSDYRDWEFTYGPLTVLNVTYSPNYEITWFYQNISIFVISCHFVTTDLLTSAVLVHISYQFKILQNNFRKFGDISYDKMLKTTNQHHCTRSGFQKNNNPSTIPWICLNKYLKEIVNYHLVIINMVTEMEQVFSMMLLTVYVSMLSMLCFMVYNASLYTMTDFGLVKHLSEVASMSLQVLTVCFWGEQVMLESQKVSEAAYEMNFISTDIRFQRALVLIMRRSQKPVKLTAGKFTDICLATFVWVLKTSYSAFMVLRKNNLTR